MVRGCLSKGLGIALVTTMGTGLMAARAVAQEPLETIAQLQTALDRAVCFNQWDQAIEITGVLIGSSMISSDYRSELMGFRRQLEAFSSLQAVVPDNTSCDRIYPQTIAVMPLSATVEDTETGLNWAEAILTLTQPNRRVIQLDTAPDDQINPPIPPALLENSPLPLADATPLNTVDGFSVVAGQVGQRHQAYSFLAGLGDRVTLDLDVTRILPGTLYDNDDSQLFVFDRAGNLMAHNDDDGDSQQSRIADLVIPRTDVYFVVVTSHNNDPLLDPTQLLTGWSEDGGSSFAYTLTLTGVTPAAALLR
jgi:hypothetical protein